MERIGIYLALGFLYASGLCFSSGVHGAGEALVSSCEYTAMAYNRLQTRDGAEVPTKPQNGKIRTWHILPKHFNNIL